MKELVWDIFMGKISNMLIRQDVEDQTNMSAVTLVWGSTYLDGLKKYSLAGKILTKTGLEAKNK